MRLRRSLLAPLAAAALLVATPALAIPPPFQIVASSVQTATGNGAPIPVSGIHELLVMVQCTANSGTPTLDLWLQSSSDGGTTWYDLVADWTLQTTNPLNATAKTATATKRDIIDGYSAACGTDSYWAARYTVFGQYVRAAWVMSGATSYTFSVTGVPKS